MVGKSVKVVHGDDLLYRFFRSLLTDQPEVAPNFLSRMYSTMGIWFPTDVYYSFPVLLPWVVRDSTCRGDKRKGIPDQWGAPDSFGYLRDDNSMIKSLARSLHIEGAGMPHLNGARMGTEFVASHVWRQVNHSKLASKHPLLNSFIPNLVWLPTQVSKLTDREGEIMQRILQSLAWKIYRHAPVAPHLRAVVEEAWSLIPGPSDDVDVSERLNTFVITDAFLKTRLDRLRSVISALELLDENRQLTKKVVTTRYTEGLPDVGLTERANLRTFLKRFVAPDNELPSLG